MAKEEKNLTSEQIYKKNKKISKTFKILSPVTWYLLLITSLVFLILMLKNSVGNVLEILDLLNTEKYSGLEVKEHYQALVSKWGEWNVVGGDSSLLAVRYVNVRNAMFSGLMTTYCILACITFSCAIILGKIIFPILSRHYENSNAELVNVATLQSAQQIAEMSKHKGDWF